MGATSIAGTYVPRQPAYLGEQCDSLYFRHKPQDGGGGVATLRGGAAAATGLPAVGSGNTKIGTPWPRSSLPGLFSRGQTIHHSTPALSPAAGRWRGRRLAEWC